MRGAGMTTPAHGVMGFAIGYTIYPSIWFALWCAYLSIEVDLKAWIARKGNNSWVYYNIVHSTKDPLNYLNLFRALHIWIDFPLHNLFGWTKTAYHVEIVFWALVVIYAYGAF